MSLWLPVEKPTPKQIGCHIAKVRHADLPACLKAIEKGGSLLSVTKSDALGREMQGIRTIAYVVVYEADRELEWEVYC